VRRIALPAIAAVLGLLVLAQAALPPLAEHRLRGDLEDYGSVARVDVGAFPALTLLWGHADSVDVHMRETRTGTGDLADLIARTGDTGDLDARADVLHAGPLTLRETSLVKRGKELTGKATVTEADLSAALPAALSVRPVTAQDGALVFEGTATFLGASISVRVRVVARDGALVFEPEALPAGLLSLTVFKDPRVRVESLGIEPAAGGFTVSATGRLV
jgi:hypothetical protein